MHDSHCLFLKLSVLRIRQPVMQTYVLCIPWPQLSWFNQFLSRSLQQLFEPLASLTYHFILSAKFPLQKGQRSYDTDNFDILILFSVPNPHTNLYPCLFLPIFLKVQRNNFLFCQSLANWNDLWIPFPLIFQEPHCINYCLFLLLLFHIFALLLIVGFS